VVIPLRGRFGHSIVFCATEQRFLLKKEGSIISISMTTIGRIVSFGHSSKPLGLASPRFGYSTVFCEAEQRFLLLFLEKEEYNYYRYNPLVSARGS
jgi:hypothetical protein